jgi:hypothetical protein
MFVLPGGRKDREITVTHLYPAFKQIGGGQRTGLVSASSQLPSAQNDSYTKAAFRGWHILLFCKNHWNNRIHSFLSHKWVIAILKNYRWVPSCPAFFCWRGISRTFLLGVSLDVKSSRSQLSI